MNVGFLKRMASLSRRILCLSLRAGELQAERAEPFAHPLAPSGHLVPLVVRDVARGDDEAEQRDVHTVLDACVHRQATYQNPLSHRPREDEGREGELDEVVRIQLDCASPPGSQEQARINAMRNFAVSERLKFCMNVIVAQDPS